MRISDWSSDVCSSDLAKFIGLRHELPLASVSPFLRTRLTPEYQNGEAGLDELAAQILDISRKPPLGETPRSVQSHLQGSTWAGSARDRKSVVSGKSV